MKIDEAIRERRSIRAYLPEAVPEATIRGLLDVARWSPSWRNTQAWRIWAVTGQALDDFKEAFTAKLLADAPARPDLDMPGREWPTACMERTARLMETREAVEAEAGLDASREGKLRRMGALFGAPCLLVVGTDASVAQAYAGFDCGVLVQTICLAAREQELGTCIMATAVRFPEVLHDMLPGDEGQVFVVGITLGFPDPDAALNHFPRERAELDEFVTRVS
jgi:nitroreductase